MDAIQKAVQSFCAACIIGGIVLQLFPGSAAKKCIKTVVGLYILATLIRLCEGGALPMPDLPEYAPDEPSVQQNAYQDAVLAQGKTALEAQAEQKLREQGIEVSVALTLQTGATGVYVENALVTGALPEEQDKITDCLNAMLEAQAIVFRDEG